MTEHVSLEEGLRNRKGSLLVVVTGRDGEQKNGDNWSMQKYRIRDESCEDVITCWNADISRFEVGGKYHIDSPFYKEYKGATQISIGKYTQVSLISAGNPVAAPPSGQGRIDAKELRKDTELDGPTAEFVARNAEFLYRINCHVRDKIREFEAEPAGAMIGQFTRIIFDEIRRKADAEH